MMLVKAGPSPRKMSRVESASKIAMNTPPTMPSKYGPAPSVVKSAREVSVNKNAG